MYHRRREPRRLNAVRRARDIREKLLRSGKPCRLHLKATFHLKDLLDLFFDSLLPIVWPCNCKMQRQSSLPNSMLMKWLPLHLGFRVRVWVI